MENLKQENVSPSPTTDEWKEAEGLPFPKAWGDYVLDQKDITPITTHAQSGYYYHYADVCTILKRAYQSLQSEVNRLQGELGKLNDAHKTLYKSYYEVHDKAEAHLKTITDLTNQLEEAKEKFDAARNLLNCVPITNGNVYLPAFREKLKEYREKVLPPEDIEALGKGEYLFSESQLNQERDKGAVKWVKAFAEWLSEWSYFKSKGEWMDYSGNHYTNEQLAEKFLSESPLTNNKEAGNNSKP